MATIIEIIQQNDVNIRQKTLPSTITKANDSNMRDVVAEEIRVRGHIQAASTGELSSHSHLNTTCVMVHHVGFFVAVETPDPADDDTTFESADSGWLWEKMIDISATSGMDKLTRTADATYTLVDGWQIDQINLKPTTAQTQKVGLTASGEEIMEATELEANVTKPIIVIVIAEGADKTIYFTGITASTLITIYKKKL